ncbi:TPA: transcriptional activator NhaR, partial [Vibrio cholerae O1]
PSFYVSEVDAESSLKLIGHVDEIKEEYYVIFAERMIQHPAVKNVCDADFTNLFL